MAKESIEAPDGEVYGPYSSGIAAGGMLWLAGQIAPEAGEGISEQTAAVLAKIEELLAAAGCSRDDVVFAQVLLDDIEDFSMMNEIYGEFFAMFGSTFTLGVAVSVLFRLLSQVGFGLLGGIIWMISAERKIEGPAP